MKNGLPPKKNGRPRLTKNCEPRANPKPPRLKPKPPRPKPPRTKPPRLNPPEKPKLREEENPRPNDAPKRPPRIWPKRGTTPSTATIAATTNRRRICKL